MTWYAKPSGAYGYASAEGQANISEINGFLNGENYLLTAQAGIMGNMVAESGLNPWRWQSESVNYSGGYGLFQFTPASGYLDGCRDVYGYAPNLSTSTRTHGAFPYDGWAQLIVFNDDLLGKWTPSCWRSYWSREEYEDLWEMREYILNTYGTGLSLSLEQYKTIDYVNLAAFAFLACYEGPLIPNLLPRETMANRIYTMITGERPPTPPKLKKDGFKVWQMALRHR